MKKSNKKIILICLSVLAVLLVLGITLTAILITKELTASKYFASLTNSNHTKQVQQTVIFENNITLYEKTETMIISGGKVYHKIIEKTLSQNSLETYETEETEYYYAKNKIYYFENNEWKTADFNLNNQLKRYNFKEQYFSLLTFDKEIAQVGQLTGDIKNENIKNVFGENSNFQNANLEIEVNNKVKILGYKITAINASQQNVEILSTYTYATESVTLPV